MNKQEAYKILTDDNQAVLDSSYQFNKKWVEAYHIAVNNLQQSKKIIQTNKTYKGMLQKQNKVIDAMAEVICELNPLNKNPQEVREYFEKISK